MSDARSSDLLRRVRTLFGSGVVAGLSDSELLERFCAQRATAEGAALAAEAAFAALVARHGPMVLGVCRRALADANDVEDAFQATFLVLVRRARSVRVGDSLGRWLYGVARRVAAKARARAERDRVRTTPLEDDPVAPDDPADRTRLLAELDEEVSRLPEKYRAPVILCHLEGLTHAEAADRLRWPVGTVSGRLSRARDLLRDRLDRRGMAPGIAMLTSEGARAAVPEPLATATVRAATQLTTGEASQAGAVSASALSLMNAAFRAAAVTRLKIATGVMLVIAMAGAAFAAGVKRGAGARGPASDQDTGPAPSVALRAATDPSADHRPADEIVQEIEAALVSAAELRTVNQFELRLLPKLNDLSTLPTAGKNLFVVADVNHALRLRMFDVHGKMVLDSDAKRFTNTWADYLQQLVPRLWPPHELTEIDRISVVGAIRNLAGQNWPNETQRTHGRIASLVGELRAAYPHDARVARYLPERWNSLRTSGPWTVVDPEVREVLETTKDPGLRTSALYFQTYFGILRPTDGRSAVSLAESFARQAPGDKRAGELLHLAGHKLGVDRGLMVGLAAVFATFAGLLAATIGIRRWLKYVVRIGAVLLALFAIAVPVSCFLANDTLIATIRYVSERISDGTAAVAMFLPRQFEPETFPQLGVLAGTIRASVAVILSALCGVLLVVARRRFGESPPRWPSAIRLGILTFFAVLAPLCAFDAWLIGRQQNSIRERIARGDVVTLWEVGGQQRRQANSIWSDDLAEFGVHQSALLTDLAGSAHQPLALVLAGVVRVRHGRGPVIPGGIGDSRTGGDGQLWTEETV
jgi:RNA polymerase sigma factor (sigma-70 family)